MSIYQFRFRLRFLISIKKLDHVLWAQSENDWFVSLERQK